MNLQDALQKIIDEIPKGLVFDSHHVIDQLIIKYSDEYINYVSKFANKSNPTLAAHGNIGQEIKRIPNVQKQELKSWSYNIHGKPNACTLWEKI